MPKKNYRILVFCSIIFFIASCGSVKLDVEKVTDKASSNTDLSQTKENSNKGLENNIDSKSKDGEVELKSDTALNEGHSPNYDLIFQAYTKCSDFEWLNEIDFNPCEAIDKELPGFPDIIDSIYDFNFERVSLWNTGAKDDIIMNASIDMEFDGFDLVMVFVKDNDKYNAVCTLTGTGAIKHEIVDIEDDGKSEIVFNNTTTDYRYGWINIYRFKDKTRMDLIFKKDNIDLALYQISYKFIEGELPNELLITEDKTYINNENEQKIAETIQYLYTFNDQEYILNRTETIYKSPLEDYKTDMLG
jgi:hypothetical protein